MLRDKDPHPQKPTGRPPTLSFEHRIEVTLAYLRTNRTQHDLAYQYGVDQSRISGILIAYTSLIAASLKHLIPTVDDLDPEEPLVIDGTLVPNWSWKTNPEDYSGKWKTTGFNIQVACSLSGDLRWVSDPLPGCTHDSMAIRDSGLLDVDEMPSHIGDKGYQGVLPITPIKLQPGENTLAPGDEEFNKSVNQIRSCVERAIANLKIWRILFSDYRRPRDTHAETITAVLGLTFFAMGFA